MKKISQHLDDELLRYLDGQLDPATKRKVELALEQDEALKQRLSQLQAMDSHLRNNVLEAPSKNFTQLVMSRLDQYPVRATGFSLFNSILLMVGILLMTGIATVLVSSGVFDHTQGTLDLNTMKLPTQYLQRSLPSIPIDGKLIMNVIIVLNVGLCLLVFDRTILKPYFKHRMQMGN